MSTMRAGAFDVAFHQVEQIGPACETTRRRLAQVEDRFINGTCAYVIEGLHE
jgi:hypothetical protein